LTVFRIDAIGSSAAAANAVGQRLSALFAAPRSGRAIDPRLIRIAEFALAISIGLLLASGFWTILGPIAHPSTTPKAGAAPAAQTAPGAIDPFRTPALDTAQAAEPGGLGFGPDLAETSLNLVLHGTWTTPEGGAAFIRTPDDKQGRYSVGDMIASGARLENVYRDQVVINRGGVRESLRLINRDQAGAARPAQNIPQTDKIQSGFGAGAKIGQYVVARPEVGAGGAVRLVLQPAGDSRNFEALGLRAGDAVVSVDNKPFGPDLAANLASLSALEGRRSVSVSIERDGVIMPVTIALQNSDEIEE